jgi:Cof subfamily protein (haloacid dehalogenase superfamily)
MKLIATDLDGTLLNEKGEVSIENAYAIKKAMNHGIQFVVATGRSYKAANNPLQAMNITCPIICLNGAITYDINQKLARKVPMDITVCKEVLSVCQEANMYIEFFTNQSVFSVSREYFLKVMMDIIKSANPDVSEEHIRERAEARFQNDQVQFIDNYDEVFLMEHIDIYKILGFSLEKNKLKEVYSKLEHKEGLTITSSGDINLEFNHPDAQKGIALEILAKGMGIQMEEVMALGDNLNDKSMLQRSGRGVAMGNATEEIKELCEYKTKTNNEHGVAFAIEEMLKEIGI